MENEKEIKNLLEEAKSLAKKYKKLTGKPLGITGEVAEFTAAQLLKLELSQARQEGYDALRHTQNKIQKIQIKGRSGPVKYKPSAKLGAIKLNKEWDVVVFVLLDEEYEPIAIHEADRESISKALKAPDSKARNDRGQLSIGKFISIGRQIWP